MKRVLVTGAKGFIGRHAVPLLLARDYEVHAVSSRFSSQAADGISWHQADLTNADSAAALITRVRPTHLLHFAWNVVHGVFWTSFDNIRWVQASLHLLQAFEKNGGERAVVSGTCAEYEWSGGYCSENRTPYLPATLYGAAKLSLHVLLDAFSRQAGISTAWGHIFLLYGPDEPPKRLVASVITSLLRKESIRCSHGEQIRDFLYVKDVADAFVALLDSNVTGPVNIVSGTPTSLREVVDRIAERLGGRELVQYGALISDEPLVLLGDSRRLNIEVCWIPKYSLEDGIQETIEWWRSRCP